MLRLRNCGVLFKRMSSESLQGERSQESMQDDADGLERVSTGYEQKPRCFRASCFFSHIEHGMKSVNNNFLAKLANVDIRRHAAGIKKMILQDAPLKNAALHDIVIFVFYGGATTPWIKLSHIDEVVKTQPDNETNRRTLKIMRESLAADKMNMFLQHFRGGNEPSSEVHEISTSIIAEAHTACTTLVPGCVEHTALGACTSSNVRRAGAPYYSAWTRLTIVFVKFTKNIGLRFRYRE